MVQNLLFLMQLLLGRWTNKIEFLFQGEYKRQQGEDLL